MIHFWLKGNAQMTLTNAEKLLLIMLSEIHEKLLIRIALAAEFCPSLASSRYLPGAGALIWTLPSAWGVINQTEAGCVVRSAIAVGIAELFRKIIGRYLGATERRECYRPADPRAKL